MMLRHSLKEKRGASLIEKAIKSVLKDGYRTKDLSLFDAKEILSTSEMGDTITFYIKNNSDYLAI